MNQQYSQTQPATHEAPQDANHVHVWLLFHDSLPVPQPLKPSALLSKQELQRQDRFATPELQYRFQCRREMLRRTLSLYRPDIREPEWIFTQNEYGKPQIHPSQTQDNLFFNLSHTKRMTVLAISAIKECGIDIENTAISRPISYLDIADRFFTDQESVDIKQGSIDYQIQRFFDYWTLKEAYIKAVGKGLSIGLDRFQFIIKPGSPITIDFPAPAIDQSDSWLFHQDTLADDMRLAIALRSSSNDTIRCELREFDYKSLTS